MSTVPYVVGKTSNGEISQDIFSRLLSDRIIYLGEDVNSKTAALIVAQLLYLESEDPDADIHLYINSPGGEVTSGFAIYDTMNLIKCDVSTICVGLAASFGAFLLAAGTRGKRYALPNAEIMIHQPSISGNIKGSVSDIKIISDNIQRNKRKLNQMLADNTGHSVEEIDIDTDRDNFMTSEEAALYGIIDKVVYSYRDID
jgi:ATP-dependent Clp protease protease subunit